MPRCSTSALTIRRVFVLLLAAAPALHYDHQLALRENVQLHRLTEAPLDATVNVLCQLTWSKSGFSSGKRNG